MAKTTTPFPVLFADEPERWQWPTPPFAWRHLPVPTHDVPQPCFIESLSGSVVHGEMLAFDPAERTVTLRTSAATVPAKVPFARFCRLAMTTPLRAAPQMAGAPVERPPSAAQEREYRLHSKSHPAPMVGRTAGHVETEHGLYLFEPNEGEASLQRVFIPRSAYERSEFGPSAEEIAASRWIAEPQALLEAIERQQRMPVLPLGHSLLALGLLTSEQLNHALAEKNDKMRLGERLVAAGVIKRADLQTAIAHKLGFPMVDLTRFPIDPVALAKVPQRLAVGYRALPLMLSGVRLIVAVDNPSRIAKLGTMHAIAGVSVVPVLSPKAQIVAALERLAHDVWASNVPQRVGFFATTV